jgi:signal peptidase I
MLPSIAVGESIVIDKLERDPVRGRVIVFRAPEKPESEYVKRIVGIPGDTISTRGTEVVLNGAPIPRCDVGAWSYVEESGKVRSGELFLESLEGAAWLVFHDAAGSVVAPSGPWTVAPGEVFVLADNRDNSHDSRVWFGGKGGGLPLRFIVGVAREVAPVLPKGAESLQPAFEQCVARLAK